MSVGQPGGITGDEYLALSGRVFATSALAIGATLLLGAGFVVHVFRGGTVPSAERGRWAGLLILCGFCAIPVYWWRHIWRAGSARAE
jgi:hypothetical protein